MEVCGEGEDSFRKYFFKYVENINLINIIKSLISWVLMLYLYYI